jgi:hypothetical protein
MFIPDPGSQFFPSRIPDQKDSRIPDQKDFRIPDPDSHPHQEFKYFYPKKKKKDTGSRIRIHKTVLLNQKGRNQITRARHELQNNHNGGRKKKT